MNSDPTNLSRRAMMARSVTGLMATVLGAFAITAPNAGAIPPYYGTERRVSRRTARRTTRRVSRRRYFFGLPGGAAPYVYGGYRYYHAGGLYYYPYMLSGRTVYVQIDVSNGRPLPPPPASQIRVDIDF